MTADTNTEQAKLPSIAIVMPCYNEEAVLPITLQTMLGILDRLSSEGLASADSFILCSNDGSRDRTWEIIRQYHNSDSRVKGISLAHNRGQQAALFAGLMTARHSADAVISIDADLQDSPEAIFEMVRLYHQGKEIVYGVRSDRSSDTWFKRSSARGFYRFQKAMGLETVFDHSDYRLMSRRALELLSQYEESNLFLRGIVPNIGLDTAIVKYPRNPRVAGETKYPLSKMLSLSIDGITSFTARPMRVIFVVGMILLLIDIIIAIWVFGSYFAGNVISGWSSIMLSIWFLGSLILIALGTIGEYIGKIYTEVKHRPRFAVKDKIWE